MKMRKLMFIAAIAAFSAASCGGNRQNDGSEGMGDSLEQEMTPTDTMGMPVDTAVDTSIIDTAAMP